MKMIARTLFICLLLVVAACSTKQYQLSEGTYVGAGEGAVLKVPARLQILAVNGSPIPNLSSQFLMNDAEVVLPQGVHELEVRYRDIWDIGRDDHMKVVSDSKFMNLKAEPGKTYQLTYKEPADLQTAKIFAENPHFVVVEVGAMAKIEAPTEKQIEQQRIAQQP
ncbi:MAG: DUF2057 family protein, partial [Bdellovibrionales bacterium]|nr:DUF2057 family protein [Bdellovibrionales bacterium]